MVGGSSLPVGGMHLPDVGVGSSSLQSRVSYELFEEDVS